MSNGTSVPSNLDDEYLELWESLWKTISKQIRRAESEDGSLSASQLKEFLSFLREAEPMISRLKFKQEYQVTHSANEGAKNQTVDGVPDVDIQFLKSTCRIGYDGSYDYSKLSDKEREAVEAYDVKIDQKVKVREYATDFD